MMVEETLKNEKELVALRMNQELSKQNMYTGIAIGLLLLLGAITFFIVRGSRIQKNLNKQLKLKTIEQENSQKKLEELHETKNKLFSIIGHDLKGPILSFQSILDLLISGQINVDDFMSFIPKITKDVNYLHFTLHNLLAWANTQMTGMIVTPTEVDISEVIDQNFN